jgi:lysophospholipase
MKILFFLWLASLGIIPTLGKAKVDLSLPNSIDLKSALTSGDLCQNQTPFWKIKKLSVPRRTHTKPSIFNSNGNPIESQEKYQLRYSIYGCKLGTKGSIVVVPGRGEGSVEFYETAVTLINKGYSPIYVIDPRGQGFSPRLLDLEKGHLENFNHYISDFEHLTKEVLSDLSKKGRTKQPLFYLSNSMGAGIGLGYFMRNKKTPYKAAAMLGPMIRINYIAFNNKRPTWFNNLIYSENGAILQAAIKCLLGQCEEYADAKNFGSYKPNTRKFVANNENKMTHSKSRYDYKTFLLDEFDWSKIKKENFASNENWESLRIGGATFGWVLASTYFLKKLKSKEGIHKLANVPFNLIAGENDNRIYRPYLDGSHNLSRVKSYCMSVNKFNRHNNKNLCKVTPIKNGFHELHKEKDQIRDIVFNQIDNFYQKFRE